MSPHDLVAECAATLAPLEAASHRAWWDAAVDASSENEALRVAADTAYSDALADPDGFADVRAARTHGSPDPLVARQLDVLERVGTPHQIPPDLRRQLIALETDVEARFSRHRGRIDGEAVDDNTIAEILRTSADQQERRAAWEASKAVGAEVAADVRRLAELRNTAATALGYRDYFAMALATSEFDEARLLATLDEVDRLTAAPFAALKRRLDEQLAERFGISVDALRPWHYEDVFFQEPPREVTVDLDPFLEGADLEALTVRTFDAMGLDVRDVMARSDLRPREGKNQHAFCLHVDRGPDVRVLSNNVAGAYWSETMLHEFGHAVYDCGLDPELPWLLRDMHMCLTEGVAMRCGRLVHEPRWLSTIAGVPAATVEELTPRLRAARHAEALVFCRWVLVMTNFERGLYADPSGPHDRRWWDLVEQFQLVRRPDGREAPDWAAKIHVAAAPVYYQNYLYGELFASQLAETFGDLLAGAGPALARKVFAPGESRRWDRLVEQATGAPLSPAALARELATLTG